ncbi:alpha/beta hydrolase [Cupriavidus basilensis]|uniref:Alpha/beta hydrolase n=1 Tax=Cupriavidus basilensis TaxID=68895 RepID=A0ABT6AL27_9BURK|nr:alpha/beta hydrolase [Cupriavidus basilensis]MDF3833128.1 alpha/beta hydrolase [Cupriavidus basilensis]
MTLLIAYIAVAVVVVVVLGLVAFTWLMARKVEKALPPKGKFIEIDGARIHYIDKGNGPAIVMVHGLGGQSGNFSYALLERLASRFRVILVDRPGSGYSTRPAAMSARLPVQSAVVAKFIRAIGLQRPLLVGHSLGGAVALGVALDHADAISGLALIAPLTHPVEGTPASFRALAISSAAVRRVVAWTWAIPRSILRGRAMMELVFSPDRPPQDFGTAGGGLLGLRPGSFYAASSDMVSIADDLPGMARRYATLALPVSILFGTEDGILDWQAQGKAMKDKLPALDLELVPGGHMLPITIPDRTAAWLTAVAGRL